MAASAGLLLAGLIALAGGQQTPPIFQPGAPGAAPRVVTPAEALALGRSTFIQDDVAFMQGKVTTARFYAEHILPRTAALRDAVLNGAESALALPLEAF